jgi:hypothetical protein
MYRILAILALFILSACAGQPAEQTLVYYQSTDQQNQKTLVTSDFFVPPKGVFDESRCPKDWNKRITIHQNGGYYSESLEHAGVNCGPDAATNYTRRQPVYVVPRPASSDPYQPYPLGPYQGQYQQGVDP